MATFTKPPFSWKWYWSCFNSRKLLSVSLVLDFLKLSVNLGASHGKWLIFVVLPIWLHLHFMQFYHKKRFIILITGSSVAIKWPILWRWSNLSCPLDPFVCDPLVPEADRTPEVVAPWVVLTDVVVVEPVESIALHRLHGNAWNVLICPSIMRHFFLKIAIGIDISTAVVTRN